MKNLYLGVDIGSVSINIVAVDEENQLAFKNYIPVTQVVQLSWRIIKSEELELLGVGGS